MAKTLFLRWRRVLRRSHAAGSCCGAGEHGPIALFGIGETHLGPMHPRVRARLGAGIGPGCGGGPLHRGGDAAKGLQASPLANPWKIGVHGDRDEVVDRFAEFARSTASVRLGARKRFPFLASLPAGCALSRTCTVTVAHRRGGGRGSECTASSGPGLRLADFRGRGDCSHGPGGPGRAAEGPRECARSPHRGRLRPVLAGEVKSTRPSGCTAESVTSPAARVGCCSAPLVRPAGWRRHEVGLQLSRWRACLARALAGGHCGAGAPVVDADGRRRSLP